MQQEIMLPCPQKASRRVGPARRTLRLEKATGERKIELKEEQIKLLERFSPEFRERHIEAPHTGILEGLSTPSLSAFVDTTGIT